MRKTLSIKSAEGAKLLARSSPDDNTNCLIYGEVIRFLYSSQDTSSKYAPSPTRNQTDESSQAGNQFMGYKVFKQLRHYYIKS